MIFNYGKSQYSLSVFSRSTLFFGKRWGEGKETQNFGGFLFIFLNVGGGKKHHSTIVLTCKPVIP